MLYSIQLRIYQNVELAEVIELFNSIKSKLYNARSCDASQRATFRLLKFKWASSIFRLV